MAADTPRAETAIEPSRRRWRWGLFSGIPIGAIAFACWWLTDPLEPASTLVASIAEPASPNPGPTPTEPVSLEWPRDRIDGLAAKRRLLDILRADQETLRNVEGYTALFHKRERIRGVLRNEETLEMKVRCRPFSVYFKFRTPEAGKEVVYAEGRYDNHVIAHGAGFSRLLIPRLKVAPTHPLALADSRHPVTEAGLHKLVDKLVAFRELDLIDAEAVTILDQWADDEGRPWLRSIHTHPVQEPERPFAKVEVLYHPETKLPWRITSYDWPKAGDSGDLNLAEQYTYDDLHLGDSFSDLDFDPANSAYAFTRF
ncbi:MAG: DUF1571 domain-containing protein [Isosphaeraceae bacterium]